MDAQQIITTINELVTQWGLKVVGAIAVLILGRIIAGGFRRSTRALLERANMDATLIPFISSLVYYLLLAFVVIAVLGIFGIPTASFVAVLGAAGLAVGLALQGTLSNFAAGVMLLIFRPFKVGDYVEAGGTAGSVEEIAIFSTTLKSPDNIKIVVPNSQVYGSTIKNYTGNDTRRIDMVMGIAYDDNISVALETITKVVTSHPNVLAEPQTQIEVAELADSSVNIVVRPWVATSDYWPTRFELTRALKEALESAGCSIPFPQRDVHVYQHTDAA